MRPSRSSPFLLKHRLSTEIFVATLESIEEMGRSFEPIIVQKISEVVEVQSQLPELNSSEMLHTEWNNWVHDRLGDEYDRYSEWINLLRHSLLLVLGSFFEDHLKRMAESFLVFKNEPPIKWREQKHKGPRAPRHVLIKQGIPREVFGRSWDDLMNVYEIRNKIAHAGGRHGKRTANLKMPNILCKSSDNPKKI